MSGTKARTGLIFIGYSLIITVFILITAVVFMKSATKKQVVSDEYVVYTARAVLLDALQSTSLIPLNSSQHLVNMSDVEDYYINSLLGNLPWVILILFVTLMIGTWSLWRVLLRLNEHQAFEIANELSVLAENPHVFRGNELIRGSYEKIRSRFDEYAAYYIKLCSYITHEQKNIISLIRGRLQLAGADELLSEVDKMASGIDDVLTLSAMKESAVLEPVDSALVCARVCDEYRKIFPNITFQFDEYSNNRIMTKEMWLYRAVCNLVDNAVKYGDGTEIQIGIKNKKGSTIITVLDSGAGIPYDEQDRLFDNRYRVKGLNKNGYGIGLNLVLHVCELSGGFTWVESSPGNGSTFFMIFPEDANLK